MGGQYQRGGFNSFPRASKGAEAGDDSNKVVPHAPVVTSHQTLVHVTWKRLETASAVSIERFETILERYRLDRYRDQAVLERGSVVDSMIEASEELPGYLFTATYTLSGVSGIQGVTDVLNGAAHECEQVFIRPAPSKLLKLAEAKRKEAEKEKNKAAVETARLQKVRERALKRLKPHELEALGIKSGAAPSDNGARPMSPIP